MARDQQSFGKRDQLEEWYPQAAAHIHDLAKARILQQAKFVKKSSLWILTQRSAAEDVPHEGPPVLRGWSVDLVRENTARLAAKLSGQKSSTEKEVGARSVGLQTSFFT